MGYIMADTDFTIKHGAFCVRNFIELVIFLQLLGKVIMISTKYLAKKTSLISYLTLNYIIRKLNHHQVLVK